MATATLTIEQQEYEVEIDRFDDLKFDARGAWSGEAAAKYLHRTSFIDNLLLHDDKTCFAVSRRGLNPSRRLKKGDSVLLDGVSMQVFGINDNPDTWAERLQVRLLFLRNSQNAWARLCGSLVTGILGLWITER